MNRIQCLFGAIALIAGAAHLRAEAPPPKWGGVPPTFEENRGQTADAVRFLVRGNGYTVFLTDDETVMGFAGSNREPARMIPFGANRDARFEALDQQPGGSHYFLGNSNGLGATASRYAKVRRKGVWNGIDIVYYIADRQLEYDFILAAGARPSDIRLDFQGGALSIDPAGNLVLRMADGEARHGHPTAYQEKNGVRQPVSARFRRLEERRIGLEVGAYDHNLPLVIDPKLDYSTFWGGSTNAAQGELGYGITVDAQGNAYVTGVTGATDFPLASPIRSALGGATDAFVLKISADGNTVLTSTYIGGSDNDEGHDIKVDADGNIYVTGYTSSPNFPVVGGFQNKLAGGRDAYLLKLSPDGGSILYSTFLGGSSDDRGYGLAVSPEGDAYLTGATQSNNFPVKNANQPGRGGGLNDAFVTKISRNGTLEYSTFLGGAGVDLAYDIAISPDGNAYVTGYTTSVNFPQRNVNGFTTPFFGGPDDVFVARLGPTGSLILSVLVGGVGSDEGVGIALDSDLNIYVTGFTASVNFPVRNAIQPFLAGAADVFVTRIHNDGSQIDFSTYWGSTESEGGVGIAIDEGGFVHVAGFTGSFSFPLINAYQSDLNLGTPELVRDAFLLKMTRDGSAVVYSTYLGGRSNDGAVGMAIDLSGNVYVTGYTASSEFPLANALQPQLADSQDAFVTKFNDADIVGQINTQVPALGLSRISLGGIQRSALFGFAEVVVNDGSPRPTGLEIIRVSQQGVTVSEMGLPLAPLISHGRLFVESMGPQMRESIAVVNPNSEDVKLDFFFTYTTTDAGQDVSQTANSGSITLSARNQIFVLLTDYPFFLPSGLEGTFTFTSSAPVSVAAVRVQTNTVAHVILNRVPVFNLDAVADNQTAVIDHFVEGGGWHTQIVLVNNTDTDLTGSFRFLGPGNGPSTAPLDMLTTNLDATNFPYRIPAGSVFRTSTLGVDENFTSGFMEVVPDPGSFTPGSFIFLEHVEDASTTLDGHTSRDRFRMYVESAAEFDGSDQITRRLALAIVNSSNADATIQLALTGEDGIPTGQSTLLTMPARTQISRFLDELPGFSTMGTFHGLLSMTVITGTGITATGIQSMLNEDGAFLLTTTGPIVEDADAVSSVFPYIPTGAQYETRLIIFGPAGGGGTSGVVHTLDSLGHDLFLVLE